MTEPIAELLDLEDLSVADIKKDADSITIYTKLKTRPQCPHCGGGVCSKNGPYKRIFQDLPIGNKKTLISFSDHEYRCLNEGCDMRIFVPQIPIVPKKGRMTARLESAIAEEAFGKNTFLAVAERYGTSEETVRRIFMKRLKHYDDVVEYSPMEHMGIDEVHLTEGACLVLVDTTTKPAKLVDILSNRRKDTVEKALTRIHSPSTIKTVTMDMTPTYRDAVHLCLPGAKVIVDHFHVTKHLMDAMNDARHAYHETIKREIKAIEDPVKREKEDRRLKKIGVNHFWFRTNFEDLSEHSAGRLAALIAAYPEFGVIVSLKESFREVYTAETRSIAEQRYDDWVKTIPDDELYDPFRKFTAMVGRWREWIFNFFDEPVGSRHSNGPIEAMNGTIRQVSRNGYGYKFEVLRGKMLYGKLTCEVAEEACTTSLMRFMSMDMSPETVSSMYRLMTFMTDTRHFHFSGEDSETLLSGFRMELLHNSNTLPVAFECARQLDGQTDMATTLFANSIPADVLEHELQSYMASSYETPT